MGTVRLRDCGKENARAYLFGPSVMKKRVL
jgi:hypothetical protein